MEIEFYVFVNGTKQLQTTGNKNPAPIKSIKLG
jgi:hypothetical protein